MDRLSQLAERVEECFESGEIPEWDKCAQSSMIRWVQRKWSVCGSYAWAIVQRWMQTYDRYCQKYMRM